MIRWLFNCFNFALLFVLICFTFLIRPVNFGTLAVSICQCFFIFTLTYGNSVIPHPLWHLFSSPFGHYCFLLFISLLMDLLFVCLFWDVPSLFLYISPCILSTGSLVSLPDMLQALRPSLVCEIPSYPAGTETAANRNDRSPAPSVSLPASLLLRCRHKLLPSEYLSH